MKNFETNAIDVESMNKLAVEIKNKLVFQIRDIFSGYIESADTAIFDLANEAGSNAEQKQYFELLQCLRADKKNIMQGLSNEFKNYLKPINEVHTEIEEDDIDDGFGELSLVSQDTVEEMVQINSINAKAVEKFSESIAKLERRFEYMSEYTVEIFYKDALKPMHFCKAFKEAIAPLDITIADKLVLYKLYEVNVINKLDSIYDDLNNRLVNAGVLPKISLHKAINDKKQKPAEKVSGQNIDQVFDDQAENNQGAEQSANDIASAPQNSNANSGNAGQVRNASNSGNSNQTRAKNVTEQSPSASNTTNGSAQSNTRNDVAPSSKNIGGYPVSQASEMVSTFIGSSSSLRESGSTGAYYPQQDVLSALTIMQEEVTYQVTEEVAVKRINAAEIKQALLSTIANQQGGVINRQIDQSIEKTIDFIKLIFDAIIDDKSISDTIKTILLSLQIPVIKVSMLDQGFFVEDEHPARRLLDKVAEVGVGVTSGADELFQAINKVVKKLLNDYTTDENAFVIALSAVEKISSERAEEVDRKEKDELEKVQKIHGRKVVLNELRQLTLNKSLPEPVQHLVLKLWPTMMFNHFMTHGKENDDWITLVTTLKELIDILQAPTNSEQFRELKNNHMPVTIRVQRQLNKFKKIKDHKDEAIEALRNVFRELMSVYETADYEVATDLLQQQGINTESASNEKIVQALDDEKDEVLINEPIDEEDIYDAQSLDKRDQLQLLPTEVRPGVWFRILMENGRSRRLKLSVVLIDEALLIFVDHNGDRVVEKDAITFAKELKAEKAEIIINNSVFDSAMGSVFNTIK